MPLVESIICSDIGKSYFIDRAYSVHDNFPFWFFFFWKAPFEFWVTNKLSWKKRLKEFFCYWTFLHHFIYPLIKSNVTLFTVHSFFLSFFFSLFVIPCERMHNKFCVLRASKPFKWVLGVKIFTPTVKKIVSS